MKRIALPSVFLVLAALAAFAASAPAPEKANLTPEALREVATHVVVGEVRAIYSRTVRDGSWEVTHHIAEVAPSNVEKGKIAAPDGDDGAGLVYARYWTRRWTGFFSAPPSTSGHRGVPAVGETLRIYLARNAYDGFYTDNDDGGFNVIGANGFERLKAEAKTGKSKG